MRKQLLAIKFGLYSDISTCISFEHTLQIYDEFIYLEKASNMGLGSAVAPEGLSHLLMTVCAVSPQATVATSMASPSELWRPKLPHWSMPAVILHARQAQ